LVGIIANRGLLEKYHAGYKSLNITLSALEYAIQSVDPKILVKKSLGLVDSTLIVTDINYKKIKFQLEKINSIYVVGAGKAAAKMTEGVCDQLKGRVSSGVINVPYDNKTRIDERISINRAGHPIPNADGLNGTLKIVETLEKANESDLIVVLISGGCSALMPLPANGISLSQKQRITNHLLTSGASIHEINIVRKHLSRIKGGQLLRFVKNGCIVISLILSDVIGDNMNTIASGPTFPDDSTFQDVAAILKKFKLWNDRGKICPIVNHVKEGMKGIISETPKKEDPIFNRVHNFLIGNNVVACNSAVNYLKKNGLNSVTLGSHYDGESRVFGALLSKLAYDFVGISKSFAFVLGGETTVEIKNAGKNAKGGRNQEAILTALLTSKIRTNVDITIASVGTDGIDGNSDAAGAVITPTTKNISKSKKVNIIKYIQDHNSHSALKRLNSQIITGLTGTNVNDIAIICRV
jgi:glycerate 2-kinase